MIPPVEANKELKAAVGWTDIKKREREVRKLVDKACGAARIDELKEIQMSGNVHDAIKDSLFQSYIADRLTQLEDGAKDE